MIQHRRSEVDFDHGVGTAMLTLAIPTSWMKVAKSVTFRGTGMDGRPTAQFNLLIHKVFHWLIQVQLPQASGRSFA
jgi:hypothetical protein